MRRLIPTLFAWLFACHLSERLEGEPCNVEKDCSRKQTCVRTDAERAADLPGICNKHDVDCIDGQQLGCTCDPADGEHDCSLPAVSSTVDYPTMTCEPMQSICIVDVSAATTEG